MLANIIAFQAKNFETFLVLESFADSSSAVGEDAV